MDPKMLDRWWFMITQLKLERDPSPSTQNNTELIKPGILGNVGQDIQKGQNLTAAVSQYTLL